MSYIDGYLLAVPSDKRDDTVPRQRRAGRCSGNGAPYAMSNAGVMMFPTARPRTSSAR